MPARQPLLSLNVVVVASVMTGCVFASCRSADPAPVAALDTPPAREMGDPRKPSRYITLAPTGSVAAPPALFMSLSEALLTTENTVHAGRDRLLVRSPQETVLVDAPLDDHGSFHGTARLFYEDGRPAFTCSFLHGRAHGVFIQYDEEGAPESSETWRLGLPPESI